MIWASYLRFISGYGWTDWTGFGEYTSPTGKFYRAKTLWDLMELLLIPLALTTIALWFNWNEKRSQLRRDEKRAQVERENANDRLQEVALQSCVEKITELLLDKHLRSSAPDGEIRTVARTLTIVTLRNLDKNRKSLLLRFLMEAGLIQGGTPIISLRGADLRQVNLRDFDLRGAHLINADLRKADLMDADLSNAQLLGADLTGANLLGAKLSGALLEGRIKLVLLC